MAIQQGKELIRHFSFYRQSMHELRKRYNISKGDFEVLCTCYDLQLPKEPYFFAPDVVRRLTTMREGNVYRSLYWLMDNNLVKLSMKTSMRSQPNYYMVTGQGESVLRSYINTIEQLINS